MLKRCRWVKDIFLEKLSFLKFLSILEENCAADIINGIFKCYRFVVKCCKKTPLGQACFPVKVVSCEVSPHLKRRLPKRSNMWGGHNFFVCVLII